MIKKVGDSYNVMDSSGKKLLGRHKTIEKAKAQLRAIEASKASKGKFKRLGGYLE